MRCHSYDFSVADLIEDWMLLDRGGLDPRAQFYRLRQISQSSLHIPVDHTQKSTMITSSIHAVHFQIDGTAVDVFVPRGDESGNSR